MIKPSESICDCKLHLPVYHPYLFTSVFCALNLVTSTHAVAPWCLFYTGSPAYRQPGAGDTRYSPYGRGPDQGRGSPYTQGPHGGPGQGGPYAGGPYGPGQQGYGPGGPGQAGYRGQDPNSQWNEPEITGMGTVYLGTACLTVVSPGERLTHRLGMTRLSLLQIITSPYISGKSSCSCCICSMVLL